MKIIRIILGILSFSFLSAKASPVTIHFDDLAAVSADGLSHLGVLYGFTRGGVASQDAIYGAPFISDSLIGDTVLLGPAVDPNDPNDFGRLSLKFAAPTNVFGFNIALSSSLTDDFVLDLILFDSVGTVLGPTSIATSVDPACDPSLSACLSEARYMYGGGVALGEVDLSFATTQATQFAISSLSYDVTAPEPGSVWFFAGGAGLLMAFRALRRSRVISTLVSGAGVRGN